MRGHHVAVKGQSEVVSEYRQKQGEYKPGSPQSRAAGAAGGEKS